MKRREGRRAQSADLLVCFPSRAHLALMPKPICSPARPSEPSKRHRSRHPHHRHQQQQQQHLIRKSSSRLGAGQASPLLLWSKSKQVGSDISEPTSPKVTCAGQIKVRHKNSTCKSWQSVMEEIERIHNERKQKKRSKWMESLGFKKEVMQFLTCLRNIRFDFRCFGSFPQPDITTDDDDENDEEEEDEVQFQGSHVGGEGNGGNEAGSRTVFSRWFMVLQENQNGGFCREEKKEKQRAYGDESIAAAPSVPPPNALLLMRCRSAPAKSWLEEKEEEEEDDDEEDDDDEKEEENKDDDEEEEEKENGKKEEKKGKNLKTLIEEEKRNDKKESFLVMRNDSDFYKMSSDIAKETWVVGGIKSNPLSRSRSWKR